MKKARRLVYTHWLFLVVSLALFFVQYWYFHRNGQIILGGEGNYWLDFQVYLEKFGLMWHNNHTGAPSTSPSSAFFLPYLLSLINEIHLQSFLISLNIYYLPFFFMYVLTFKIKGHPYLACLVSWFYVFNPYSIFINEAQIMWSSGVLSLFPLLLLIILIFHRNRLALFTAFGMSLLFFSFTLVNPPLLILVAGSVPILLSVVHLIEFHQLKIKSIVAELVILYLAFFLFNASWVFAWMTILPHANQVYNLEIAKNWLRTVSESSQYIMQDIFSFSWLTPKTIDNNFLSTYFAQPIIRQILFIPFLTLIYFSSKYKDKVVAFISFLLLLLILMLKGSNPPFKYFISTCFDLVPFCFVFKTAPEKIGYLFVFLFSIALFLALIKLKSKFFVTAFSLYIIVIAIPVLTGNYLPDKQINKNQYSTKKFIELDVFKQFKVEMNRKRLEARTLSLPTYRNYNVFINLYQNKYFLGVDPLLQNVRQAFIASYSMPGAENYLFPFDSKLKQNISDIYSIRYLVYNALLTPWIGHVSDVEMKNEKDFVWSNFKVLNVFDQITVFENKSFLPKIYVPLEVTTTDQSPAFYFGQLKDSMIDKRLLVLFETQNTKLDQIRVMKDSDKNFKTVPNLEFKKINSTKYRVRVHGANNNFFVVLNDSFSQNWKIYHTNFSHDQAVGQFPIAKFSDLDQASENEIIAYQNLSLISTNLIDDFISKQFSGTIQNDNLVNGSMAETWFQQPLNSTNLVANSYANSWLIDLTSLCPNATKCRQNDDQTYDFELILEFFPQRIYILGWLVTIATGLVAFTFLIIPVARLKAKNDSQK